MDRRGLVGLERFPRQLYFMHNGMWMGWHAYVAQSVLFISAGLWLARLVPRQTHALIPIRLAETPRRWLEGRSSCGLAKVSCRHVEISPLQRVLTSTCPPV